MINLLTKGEKRRLAFAQILSRSEDWMTLAELAQKLNCSNRVLKVDIRYFEKNYTGFTIQTSSHGVKLIFEHNQGLKLLYQQVLEN